MATVVRQLTAVETGYPPLAEMLLDTELESLTALAAAGVVDQPRGPTPNFLRYLVELSDGQLVEHGVLVNCDSFDELHAWRRHSAGCNTYLEDVTPTVIKAAHVLGRAIGKIASDWGNVWLRLK